MVVSIINSLTTVTEVCLLQGHEMNTRTVANGTTRIFSDDAINTTINNVIRFVLGNSKDDLNSNIKLFAINTLSVIALNNIMHEAGYLENWEPQDPFDKERLLLMIMTMAEESDEAIHNVLLYNDPRDYIY